jgi:Sulfotransferase domain
MTGQPEHPRTVKSRPEPFPGLHYPPAEPDIPGGWRTGPPDVVGVGTMRSGTTWCWLMLTQHPRFAMAGRFYKELHFFDHYLGVQHIDPESYHRYFPRPAGTITGEWTPRYMFDYWTAPMLRMTAPHAKLLVLLRDPIERYLSALAFTRSRGHPATHAMLHHQYSRGLYGQQIQTLLEYFPVEQILVLQYEQCVADPARHMRQIFEFIGLPSDEWQPDLDPHRSINAAKIPKPRITPATRDALGSSYRIDLRPVFELFPGLDPALWPTMRDATDLARPAV